MTKGINKKNISYKDIAIVVPIYKSQPTKEELASLKQCIKILENHPIYIVTNRNVKINIYINNTINTLHIKYFPSHFFTSTDSYSDLLRKQDFYLAFKEYKYMLIYQLDAWVFKDELMQWCEKGYDYIGAPWFSKYGSHENGDKLWKVGNGGLSLRKVKTFIKLTNPHRRLKTLLGVFKTEYNSIKDFPSCILRSFGHRNTVQYYRNFYYHVNEDVYFCISLSKYDNMKLRIPSPEEASSFAFERSPRYLYSKNNNSLPFGCHAWERYDKEFWNEFITIE